jgi:phosphodiesterase/alkaline phosphatase D-like protein
LASLGIVSWQTNILADSRARFLQGIACGEGDSWLRVITLTAQVMIHSVVLTDLTPSTDYCYQVQSGNAISTTAWTVGRSFTTLAGQFDSYLPLIFKEWAAP